MRISDWSSDVCSSDLMEEYYFSLDLGDNRTLYLSPMTDRWIAMSGEEVPDPSGYFLFEKHGDGDLASVDIIAHIPSDEAAMRLRDMFKMRDRKSTRLNSSH